MENKSWEQIDADMQRGYTHAMNNDSVQACHYWKKAWSSIVSAMDSGGYATAEDFDVDFGGLQCVYNWASDYELELHNAIVKDISFAKEMISFCTEYLNRVSDKSEHNCLNMRAAVANSYIRLGMAEDGEKWYRDLTEENPSFGCGWIRWSEEYSLYAADKDYDKAIDILKKALEVDGIDEIAEIKSQLREIYINCGKHDEANSIVIDDRDYGVPVSEIGNVASVPRNELNAAVNTIFESANTPVRKEKVGRNDPCPCGSGKKYKKCCGFN